MNLPLTPSLKNKVISFLALVILSFTLINCDAGKKEYVFVSIKNESENAFEIKFYKNSQLEDTKSISTSNSWVSEEYLASEPDGSFTFPDDVYEGDSAALIFDDGKQLSFKVGEITENNIYELNNYEKIQREKNTLIEYIYTIDQSDYQNAQ
ncbi:hypothetical protein [Marinigracilibium pacificum]|uniref:Uncharacterized protein n=1 Tax=Marinigracilibium pacificum TaxID=2729599 RepID=A0A848IQW8_9BACT|nr:hypothetical protein [Marinigracilibium pacificum]NMM46853.1 hypothetical protein [Marinigracilibium pacificum]